MGRTPTNVPVSLIRSIRELNGQGLNDRAIARAIGISYWKVGEIRRALKLPTRYTITPGTVRSDNRSHPHRQRIIELHALNWDDSAIARELGLNRRELGNYRSRHLKLAAVPRDQAVHRAEPRRKQDRTLGMNISEKRAELYWSIGPDLGWPAGLRFRAVQMLEYLLNQPNGATSAMICEALSITPARLHSNDPQGTYLANLIARGLVAAAAKTIPTGKVSKRLKSGTCGSLYFATPAARELKATWRESHGPEVEFQLLEQLAEYGRRKRAGRNSSVKGPHNER